MKTDKETEEFEKFIIEELNGEKHRAGFLMENSSHHKEIGPLNPVPLLPEEDDLANSFMDAVYRMDKVKDKEIEL